MIGHAIEVEGATVGALKKLLADVPDHIWVEVHGDGPLSSMSLDLGGAEEYVCLNAEKLCQHGARKSDEPCPACAVVKEIMAR